MSYLVDTDCVIDALNGVESAHSALLQLSPEGLSISIISVGELYEGPMRYENSDYHIARIRQFISGYDVLGLSDEIMETFARLRYDLRRTGRQIADLDLLIASTAITYDLTLVTRNLRHFNRIEGLNIHTETDDL